MHSEKSRIEYFSLEELLVLLSTELLLHLVHILVALFRSSCG